MKTSFAKTFNDLCNGTETKDLIFPERVTERIIKDENNKDIISKEVFVIEPYNEKFDSDKLSTLLVTQDLKKEYDDAYSEIEVEKINFIKKLKSISQSSDCEFEFISAFAKSQDDGFFGLLTNLSGSLNEKLQRYSFKYNDVFDKKGNVKKFLDKHKGSLELYIKNYEVLISKSNFFKKSKNTFGTHQAGKILESISDGSFFEAGHLLELTDKTKVNSAKVFGDLLQSEIDKVIGDVKLKKIFDGVDKAIGSNIELRAFKLVIEQNNLLLIELSDYEQFKQKVWLGYLDQLRMDVNSLVEFYNLRRTKLEAIISRAKSEFTEWERSIKEFNERFKNLPFKLAIKNREDVMLKTSKPTVEFIFYDLQGEKVIERNDLITVLSQGERRALYLLNIIFEVQARRKIKQNTLFIIDDIADSFDYKNKYAIIQYLKDISDDKLFNQVILTHNFDFFRTLESRGIIKYKDCLFSFKTDDKVILERAAGGIKNPFILDWKKNLHEDKKLIASIPFVRNIIEYTDGEDNEDYKKLTSLLHWKIDTDVISVGDVKLIYERNMRNLNFPLGDKSARISDKIFEVADTCLTAGEGINLENKIVLSIAIRLLAEKFMIHKIGDQDFVSKITNNQTSVLISKFKEQFKSDVLSIDLLEQVNLMTPENIHINSFMYEPILDLGDKHLKDLYSKIKSL